MRIGKCSKQRIVATVATLAVFLASCGSDAESRVQTANDATVQAAENADTSDTDTSEGSENVDPTPVPTNEPAAEVASPPDSPETAESEESNGSAEPTWLELDPARWDGLTEWNLPVMGGLTFGVPEGVDVIHDGDMVAIRAESDLDSGAYNPTMIIARVFQTPPGLPVNAIDMRTSAIAGIGSAEPTHTRLSLLGEELEGWQFTLNPDKGDGPFLSYSAYPAGTGGPTTWDPFPRGEVFLADVPGGVLAVGWIGQDVEELAQSREIFDRVAPTLELIRPFSETTDPVTPPDLGETEPPPDPVALPDGWSPLLTELSAPIPAGDYSHVGFKTAFSFSLEEGWWVQPNFPAWLVLTADESSGPGDRDVVFRGGVTRLVPAVRSGAAGDGRVLDLVDLVDDPPESIVIGDSGEVAVGGATGFRVRFSFDESADCAGGAICEYWIMTKYPFPPASMRTGYQHELWHLDGGLVEPITIIVSSSEDRWFDRAAELMGTFEFDLAGQ